MWCMGVMGHMLMRNDHIDNRYVLLEEKAISQRAIIACAPLCTSCTIVAFVWAYVSRSWW